MTTPDEAEGPRDHPVARTMFESDAASRTLGIELVEVSADHAER